MRAHHARVVGRSRQEIRRKNLVYSSCLYCVLVNYPDGCGARETTPGEPVDPPTPEIFFIFLLTHAFRTLGLEPGQRTCIGLYAKNRPEWIMTEHATYTFSNVLVPLYETLGADACIFILNQAEIELVVCDAVDKAIGKWVVISFFLRGKK